jgi:hypothetical protein
MTTKKPDPIRYVSTAVDRPDAWACGVCGRFLGYGDAGLSLAQRCCPPRPCSHPGCTELTASYSYCTAHEYERHLAQLRAEVSHATRVESPAEPLFDPDHCGKMYFSEEEYYEDVEDRIHDAPPEGCVMVSPVLFVMEELTLSAERILDEIIDNVSDNDNDDGDLRQALTANTPEVKALTAALDAWAESLPTWYMQDDACYVDVRNDVRAVLNERFPGSEGTRWEFLPLLPE